MDKLEMDLLSRLLVAMKECKVRRKDRDGDQQLCEVVTNVVTKNTTHLGGEPNTKLCLNKFFCSFSDSCHRCNIFFTLTQHKEEMLDKNWFLAWFRSLILLPRFQGKLKYSQLWSKCCVPSDFVYWSWNSPHILCDYSETGPLRKWLGLTNMTIIQNPTIFSCKLGQSHSYKLLQWILPPSHKRLDVYYLQDIHETFLGLEKPGRIEGRDPESQAEDINGSPSLNLKTFQSYLSSSLQYIGSQFCLFLIGYWKHFQLIWPAKGE